MFQNVSSGMPMLPRAYQQVKHLSKFLVYLVQNNYNYVIWEIITYVSINDSSVRVAIVRALAKKNLKLHCVPKLFNITNEKKLNRKIYA